MFCSVCAADNSAAAVNCRSCGSPLLAPASTVPDQVLPVGTLLQGGAFVLEGVLGQGGFGITYKCREPKLNRTVAIKEFFPQAQGCLRRGTAVFPSGAISIGEFQEERDKFLEEGRRLAQFQHASIVKVFSLFEENNTAYMVMEFLRGQTLLDVVERHGPLEERIVVDYVEQIAGALAVVHQANLIHRDIKPENVMITSGNRAVLVDFGTAREFAAGKTRKMTAMLTPGYAPLEQYGQHARFGTFTDIYALGATAYHVITGYVPVQSTDRASGVELPAPRQVRSDVTRQVSEALMWALEMRVDRRPQSTSEFVQAIRGRRSASTVSTGGNSAATLDGRAHRHESQIRDLLAELESPPRPFQPSQDGRIQQISSELSKISLSSPAQSSDCPCCGRSSLQVVEGQRSRQCPVCSSADLKMRKLDQTLCPVCRDGHLVGIKLERQMMFCPICRARSLREEKRKRFGLSLDLWWVCPGCSAEFDVILGGRAKLVSVGQDPLGVGKTHEGQTLTLAAWQKLAPLSEELWTCDRCDAQFYGVEDSRLCLDSTNHDPHGTGAKYLGKTFYRSIWIKLANGLSPTIGTTQCPGCSASFDYDPVVKSLKLLECDTRRFPTAAAHVGQARSLEQWSLVAAGKLSLNPGWRCGSCRSEFDKDNDAMKFVSGASQLGPLVGKSLTFEDWHRWTKKLPSRDEEQGLKNELATLQSARQQELAQLAKAEQTRRSRVQEQIDDLVRLVFLDGGIDLQLSTQTLILKKGERLLWESVAAKFRQRTSDGLPYWDREDFGVLAVTDQRIVFRATTGSTWSKPLSKLVTAMNDLLGQEPIVVLCLEGQQKPVAFITQSTLATITILGRPFNLEIGTGDLQAILDHQCG
jgi:serine/threonine protein kinase